MAELRRIDPTRRPGRFVRAFARVGTTRPARWVARKVSWKLDPVLLRATGGRVSSTLVVPSAVLETRGARTGELRRNTVIYFHDGDDVVVTASHAGSSRHPAWFHNLVAHPEVTFGGLPMRAAVVADPDDELRLWILADRVFPGFATYRVEASATGRTIPLVRLHPGGAPA